MKQERTHYHAHFGVYFSVVRFTVLPEDRLALRTLHFPDVGGECWRVRDFISETYDRMLAQRRPCEMVVEVSRPLTRNQADLFNLQSASVGAGATAATRKLTQHMHPYLSGFAVAAVGLAALFALESRHAEDIIVAVQARVSGGIGPQSRTVSMLLKAKGGVQ
ncbi:MAG: hypothetical protein ACRER8_10395 [Pseudomonas sp.]|uniref:hypothetical protein n=1 Tax=Pseudomonas sp. TaxID=306 RepID=UPI003D6F8061